MSYEEFYEKDVYLVKIYRKMDKIREEKKNAEMWIQGMYIYEAISTTLYNMFAKKAGQSFPDSILKTEASAIINDISIETIWI